MTTKTTAHKKLDWWQLDPRRVLVIVFLIALFSMSAREITDPDFWWHLKTGQYILETRSIPRYDVFSYGAERGGDELIEIGRGHSRRGNLAGEWERYLSIGAHLEILY